MSEVVCFGYQMLYLVERYINQALRWARGMFGGDDSQINPLNLIPRARSRRPAGGFASRLGKKDPSDFSVKYPDTP